MVKVTYHIVKHDGGWAYQVNGVFSETFPSDDMARAAAQRAAEEQRVPAKPGQSHGKTARANGTKSSPAAMIGLRPRSRVDARFTSPTRQRRN